LRRSRLVAAGLALALAPLGGMFLTERIDGRARSRPSFVSGVSGVSGAPGAAAEAVGAGSLARPSMPPPVELVGIPDLPEAATREPAGPVPMRVPAPAVEHANAARAHVPALAPSRAARAPMGTGNPEGPSPRADDLDFGF
jgi:hypothetical protein